MAPLAQTEISAEVDPAFLGALKLISGTKDEERVLGVALALHHTEALAASPAWRERLLEALDVPLLQRLLLSSPALQRLTLACLRLLVVNEGAAARLWNCVGALGAAAVAAASASADPKKAEAEELPFGSDELLQAVEVLRQFIRFAGDTAAWEELVASYEAMVALMGETGPLASTASDATVVEPVLACAQELGARAGGLPAAGFVQSACLCQGLRGSQAQRRALTLLTEGLEGGLPCECVDAALSEALAAGAPARPQALQLAAQALSRHGLGFGQGQGPLLARLRPLLSLVAAELRLGLEGHAPRENLCAACMALEAAVAALGREAESLEECGDLQQVQECLRQIHKAMADIHTYCADLPPPTQEGEESPPELALLARVVAAWQLEDGRQFSTEFQRSLPALCRLPPADFQLLLPCIQEMHDWQLTPALGAVLRSTAAALQGDDPRLSEQAWRQGALMLTEVALDAAAYLPEAVLQDNASPPPMSSSTLTDPPGPPLPPLPFAVPAARERQDLPRPLQAADSGHPGVLRLRDWSQLLWTSAAKAGLKAGAQRWELGTLCGALLVSVPEAAVLACPAATRAVRGAWADAVCCLLESGADAATWRLALRLVGFALDRHSALAEALAEAAVAAGCPGTLKPPSGALCSEEDEEDEWAPADRAAMRGVEEFLAAICASAQEARSAPPALPAAHAAGSDAVLDAMD